LTGCAGSVPVNGPFSEARELPKKAGVQRTAGPLRQVQSGERLVSVQRWTLGPPPKPSAAVSVGRGGARERTQFSPQGGNGVERTLRRRGPGAGRQRLLGVQRAKPFGAGAGRQRLLRCPEGETLGPGRIDVRVNPYWVIIWRKALRFGGFAAPGHSQESKKRETGRRAEWQKD